MKSVLFYFNNYCGENSKGGTEIATYRIAKALKETGECMVFLAYHNGNPDDESIIYDDIVVLSKEGKKFSDKLGEFIHHHKIDNVVVMSRFLKYPKILNSISKSGRKPTLIFMQHFAPGSEKKKTSYPASWHLLKLNPKRVKYYFRAFFYPLLKLPRTIRWKSVYRRAYEKSDRVVLLSEGYKKEYSNFAGLSDISKFVAIPNIFQLSQGIDNDKIIKEKRVLLMSRMDELQKRISLALKIWKNIESDPSLQDWHLDIVGDGNNKDIVKRLIKKYKFERVTYHGWQNREPFLQRNAILMMTSEYEGLPLSILEAQAYGVVPIAFNSFASLKDLIEDQENGMIVEKFGDIEDYTTKLKTLMSDPSLLKHLAQNSFLKISNFSPERIANKWLQILT